VVQPLTSQQRGWVDETLDRLSMEQCIGQMLNVSHSEEGTAYWLELFEQVPVGCMSARTASAEAYRVLLAELQAQVPIPFLVLANMEHGAAEWPGYGTAYPWPMAAGAADDEALVQTMAQAIAVEARYIGVNWVLNPVIDLNYNPDNPITNIRSMGDDPDRVSRLATAWIPALQAHGVAATAKHFPGDGMDDRDQHLVSTANSLPFEQWLETYGRVWRAAIDAGVMTVMPGHISLPDYQGYANDPAAAPPATVSRKLLIDLLRQELGFEGLIVSDSTSMVGLTSRVKPGERAVAAIAAGIDVYLNADLERDFGCLVQAVQDGRLSEEQIRASARRVLALKAQLDLHEAPLGPAPTGEQQAEFARAAQQMADESIVVLRTDGRSPVRLDAGASVLTVTVGQLSPMRRQPDLDAFDEALRERGFQVEHLLNPNTRELSAAAQAHDAVFVHVYVTPFTTMGTVRVTGGGFGSWGWRSLFNEHPCVLYTAFGSPYVAYELPHVPNLIATFSDAPVSQRAAVKVWLGELEARGTLPVRLPQVTIRSLPARPLPIG
jgi:beta-N-acetylhexosaminidase